MVHVIAPVPNGPLTITGAVGRASIKGITTDFHAAAVEGGGATIGVDAVAVDVPKQCNGAALAGRCR